jgi:hypothetical protein
MPRRKIIPETLRTETPFTAPLVLDDHAVFTVEQIRATLRLTKSTVRREVREGRLRVSRRAARYFLLGVWVRQWLEAGEITRQRPDANGTHATP